MTRDDAIRLITDRIDHEGKTQFPAAYATIAVRHVYGADLRIYDPQTEVLIPRALAQRYLTAPSGQMGPVTAELLTCLEARITDDPSPTK